MQLPEELEVGAVNIKTCARMQAILYSEFAHSIRIIWFGQQRPPIGGFGETLYYITETEKSSNVFMDAIINNQLKTNSRDA